MSSDMAIAQQKQQTLEEILIEQKYKMTIEMFKQKDIIKELLEFIDLVYDVEYFKEAEEKLKEYKEYLT